MSWANAHPESEAPQGVLISVKRALSLLDKSARFRLFGLLALQSLSALLDILGIALLGLVVAVTVSASQGSDLPEQAARLQNFLPNLESFPLGSELTLALLAALALSAKSITSLVLSKALFTLLAKQQAHVSDRLVRDFFSRPLLEVLRFPSQETSYILVYGVAAATSGLLGNAVVATAEIVLMLLLGLVLVVVNPAVTILAGLFFGLLAISTHMLVSRRIGRQGARRAQTQITSLLAIKESIESYRELQVLARRHLVTRVIADMRSNEARLVASNAFLTSLPKYVYEIGLVLGGALLAIVLFQTDGTAAAVATVAIFLAAASRLVPSILRLQTSALVIRELAGLAAPVFEFADAAMGNRVEPLGMSERQLVNAIADNHSGFYAALSVKNVTLTYPGAQRPALDGVDLEGQPGTTIALVGPSGAGKSSLADILLGVLEPDGGQATLGGIPSAEALHRWPGAISYVPQSVPVVSGSIRENVALGFTSDFVHDDWVWESLRLSQLDRYLSLSRDGLETLVGEGGSRLSGGQRQRLGLARALYSRPKLLVLDEATSALDADTEESITSALNTLGADVTRIVIAHRLSTVRRASLVVYLDKGQISARGSFEEVRSQVPDFDRHARLMGIR